MLPDTASVFQIILHSQAKLLYHCLVPVFIIYDLIDMSLQ
jgi:hypothetical protein